jgi:hypothetical protein
MQRHDIENIVRVPFLSGLADHGKRGNSGCHVRGRGDGSQRMGKEGKGGVYSTPCNCCNIAITLRTPEQAALGRAPWS